MKGYFYLPIAFFLFGNSTFGQANAISEFDLYGCWVMERVTKENGLMKRIYVACNSSEGENTVKHSDIVFSANNKCEYEAVIHDALYPIIYKNVEGTWTYDKESGIVAVYYPKDFMKEVWDAIKEEDPDMEIPNPRIKAKFKIVALQHGKLEIEKLFPTL